MLPTVVPPHLRARFDALNDLAPLPTAVPEPWKQIAVVIVGGMMSVGFTESSDLLLAASSAGRSVFDCRNGALMARDDNEKFGFDVGNLLADGIGPIAQYKIRMCGIFRGGLPRQTADGWRIERYPLSWPDDELILSPPGHSMLWSPQKQPMNLTKLSGFISEVRAFGFSPTGRSLVVATAADISIFAR